MKNKSKQRSFAPAGPKKTEPISQLEGYLDLVDATTVGGWAWNPSQPDRPAKVEIYDGTTLLAAVTAAGFREDCGSLERATESKRSITPCRKRCGMGSRIRFPPGLPAIAPN